MVAQDSSNTSKLERATAFSWRSGMGYWLGWLLKIALFAGSIWGVWYQLGQKDLLHKLYSELGLLIGFQPLLLLAVLLLPLNWGAEALKWQFLARKLEPISWWEALQGVVTGVALGFWTPQIIGDYAGRTLQLQTVGRSRSAGAIMLSNASQFIVSYVIGCAGLLYYANVYGFPNYPAVQGLSFTLGIGGCLLVLMYFNCRLFSDIAERSIPKTVLNRVLSILKEYSDKELLVVLLISLGRYLIFASQFYILFHLFQIELPLAVMLPGITIIYLVKTIIPSLNIIGDLGLREVTALFYFQQFGAWQEKVVAASLLLWCINLLIPTIGGLFLIWRIKLTTKR
jgi:hypothetical protein